MARQLRIEYNNALYHVMSRGIERRAIVRSDEDRIERIRRLRVTAETYGWIVHAFCLMTNHDHLFIQTPEPNLSDGMRCFNGGYVTWYNRRHRRSGHLFQGRHKAHIIEEDGYFREISRYIHLNPVRAKMVARPEQYRWSSYAGYHYANREVEWITYDRVLREFGRRKKQARASYRAFVRAGVTNPPESPFEDAVRGLLIGSDSFVTRIKELLSDRDEDLAVPVQAQLREKPSLEEIVDVVCEVFDGDPTDWCPGRRCDDLARPAAAWIARKTYGYRGTEVATALGYRRGSGVSVAVKRIESLRVSRAEGRRVVRKLNAVAKRLGRITND